MGFPSRATRIAPLNLLNAHCGVHIFVNFRVNLLRRRRGRGGGLRRNLRNEKQTQREERGQLIYRIEFFRHQNFVPKIIERSIPLDHNLIFVKPSVNNLSRIHTAQICSEQREIARDVLRSASLYYGGSGLRSDQTSSRLSRPSMRLRAKAVGSLVSARALVQFRRQSCRRHKVYALKTPRCSGSISWRT